MLRSSIKIRKATDEVEESPGFFEGDTVAHCGPTLKGEFARTLNLTDMHIGWVFTRTVRNNAHAHILGALKAGVHKIPYEVTGLDFDNGSEFLNKAVIKWAAQMEIFFTRSRPYKKNDQATIESKNNHLVRKYAFYYATPPPRQRRHRPPPPIRRHRRLPQTDHGRQTRRTHPLHQDPRPRPTPKSATGPGTPTMTRLQPPLAGHHGSRRSMSPFQPATRDTRHSTPKADTHHGH